GEPVRLRVTGDDCEIFVLAAIMEAEREAEAVGQGQLVVDNVARVEWIVLFGGVAREDRAPVGRDCQANIGRPRLDPPFEPAAQVPRTVEIVRRVTKIIYENQIVLPILPQYGKQRG